MGYLDGLLGAPGSDQSQALGLLAAGLVKGDFGGGLLAATNVYSPEAQMRRLQLQKAQQDLLDERNIAEAARKAYITPEQAAARSMGPTPDGSAVPQVQPGFDTQSFLSQAFSAAPLKALALQAQMAKESPYGKVDPKDYTPESVRAFASSGGRDFSLLRPRTKLENVNGVFVNPYDVQQGTVAPPDPNKPFGFNSNGQITPNLPYQQYELNKSRAGSTQVNVNTDKSYFGNFAEAMAKNDAALVDAARSAPDRITTAQRVKSILAQNPITGTGAEARLALNKALATAGLVDGKDVANTEVLASTLASQTLDAIKTSGLGAGQGFTDKDRQFLERARSGNIEMNPQTLQRLADLNENAARVSIQRGNSIIGKLRASPQSGQMGQFLDPIQEPTKSSSNVVSALPKSAPVGARARDTQTGQVLRFNGINWVPEK